MRTIVTDRLVLRDFAPEDGEGLYAYLSDPEVVQFEPYPPFTRAAAREEAARRAKDGAFIAVCRQGELIGNLYFSPENGGSRELGYVFRRDVWGQGYAHEAAYRLLLEAFAGGLHRVYAECNPENPRSWRLMERLGMRREGYFKQNVFFRRNANGLPCWQDTCLYAVLREEFMNIQPLGDGKE